MPRTSSTIHWKVRYGDAEATHTISLPAQSIHGKNILFEFQWLACAPLHDVRVGLGGVELDVAKIGTAIMRPGSTCFQLKASTLRDVAQAVRGDKHVQQQVEIEFRQSACVANCFGDVRATTFPISIMRMTGPIDLAFELPRSHAVTRVVARISGCLRRRSVTYQLAARCWPSIQGLVINNTEEASGTVIASYDGTKPLMFPAMDIVFRMPFDIALERGFGYVVTSIASFISGLLSGLVLYYLLEVR